MRGLGRPLERDREAGKCHALPLVRSVAQRPVGMPATAGRSKAISRHNPTSIPAPEDNSQSPVGGGRSTQPSRDRRADSSLEILTEPAGSSVSLLIAFVVPVSRGMKPIPIAGAFVWHALAGNHSLLASPCRRSSRRPRTHRIGAAKSSCASPIPVGRPSTPNALGRSRSCGMRCGAEMPFRTVAAQALRPAAPTVNSIASTVTGSST